MSSCAFYFHSTEQAQKKDILIQSEPFKIGQICQDSFVRNYFQAKLILPRNQKCGQRTPMERDSTEQWYSHIHNKFKVQIISEPHFRIGVWQPINLPLKLLAGHIQSCACSDTTRDQQNSLGDNYNQIYTQENNRKQMNDPIVQVHPVQSIPNHPQHNYVSL